MKTLEAIYNKYGYRIEVNGKEVYSAGANPFDSQARGIAPLRTVKGWATTTAFEMAEELGIDRKRVTVRKAGDE